MRIDKLCHNDTYTVRTAENCYTFFDEVRPDDDLYCIELRAHTRVSGVIYGDKVDDFLKLWEEMQCK